MDNIYVNLREDNNLLRDKVFHILKKNIINGNIERGERLVESSLAEKLGVSRTPVREALHFLKREGLVVEKGPKRIEACGLEAGDIVEFFEIRAVLEGLSAKFAATRWKDEDMAAIEDCLSRLEKNVEQNDEQKIIENNSRFHNLIDKCSRSTRLNKDINNYREYIEYFRKNSLLLRGRPKVVLEEHKEVYRSIKSRNAEKAEQLLKQHILNAKEALLKSEKLFNLEKKENLQKK